MDGWKGGGEDEVEGEIGWGKMGVRGMIWGEV